MSDQGVDSSSMEDYMESVRYAAPPHAGAGIELERIVMVLLQLGNIRFASLYRRDPKSLPAKSQASQLRYPEDSTLDPSLEESACQDIRKMQPRENLIANYGNATNTPGQRPVIAYGDTGRQVLHFPGFPFTVTPYCLATHYATRANTPR